jgi:hypothetical protein
MGQSRNNRWLQLQEVRQIPKRKPTYTELFSAHHGIARVGNRLFEFVV